MGNYDISAVAEETLELFDGYAPIALLSFWKFAAGAIKIFDVRVIRYDKGVEAFDVDLYSRKDNNAVWDSFTCLSVILQIKAIVIRYSDSIELVMPHVLLKNLWFEGEAIVEWRGKGMNMQIDSLQIYRPIKRELFHRGKVSSGFLRVNFALYQGLHITNDGGVSKAQGKVSRIKSELLSAPN